ncbi:GTP-binding protein LepA [Euzebyella marina]|uniref:GTP-binding protein LepA n=1 Tax=Euzebyella marina TaxID=1761453 RepID=A0A3G2L1E9_9FLAO|nr:GTP-binding protein LepA [Euzebyella marina]AYN66036.1 GTP-binding protein LepA [Euzebyella marina]
MTTYIAQFVAKHSFISTKQQSIFIWQQESGEIDKELLENKIKREAALHFYRLESKEGNDILLDEISVDVLKTMPFGG